MLVIEMAYRQLFAAVGLTTFNSIVSFFAGDLLSPRKRVTVKPHTLLETNQAPVPVFYKQYEYRPPSWRFLARSSKAFCEYENYAVLERLGIQCASRIACGELRDSLGRLRRAFIITRAIPGAMPLIDFLQAHCPSRTDERSRILRDALRSQLARMTAQIHHAGFFHHDLVWRNILVTWQPPATPQIWWIDCPRGRFDRWSPWRQRRRLRDLASLDKCASTLCTRAERLAFVREYLGQRRLDSEGAELIRAALSYRKRRWPEDWHEL
jgi:tRNA A-37 threonylcarbamoyl transferase component Bud32